MKIWSEFVNQGSKDAFEVICGDLFVFLGGGLGWILPVFTSWTWVVQRRTTRKFKLCAPGFTFSQEEFDSYLLSFNAE